MSTTREGSARLTGREPALEALLDRALAGDDVALSALLSLLYSNYGQKIIKRLRIHRKQAHTATIEDVVQESLIELVRRIQDGELKDLSLPDQDALVAYFQRLCDNRLANAIRARRNPLRAPNKLQVPLEFPDLGVPVPGQEKPEPHRLRYRRLLDQAIAGLEGTDRIVMTQYLDGVPLAEIGKGLGKSVVAVKSIIHQAKQDLLLDIASVSPTAKRELARVREARNRIPEREEVEEVVSALPKELREAVTFVHLEGGSEEELAARLGERGKEKAKSRLTMAYRSLAGRMKLPFPETFEKLAK